jgi:excisionase family DNA binding protein
VVLGGEAAGREDYRRDGQNFGEFGKGEAQGRLLMLPVKRFYRPDEVAVFLGLSRRTIYRMVKDGRITGVKFGHGPWRISRENLGKIVESLSTFPGKL